MVAGAFILLLATLIVAPGFIDWTPYRDTFARQLSVAIGRPVSVDGNVTFALVPRPALEAGQVRISKGSDSLTIAEVRAWLGVVPLLKGELHFRDLQLNDAIGTYTIDLPWSAASSGAGAAPTPAAIPPITVDVDRVEFNGGDLTLRDREGAALLRAQSMDLAVFSEGRGRLRLDGELRLNGRPMTLDARVGARGADGVRSLSVSAHVPAAQASLSVGGRVSPGNRTFNGDLTVKAERGDVLLSNVGVTIGARQALARPFSFAAKVSTDETGVAFREVVFDAGGTSAKGTMEWRRARAPQVTARFDFAPFALDDWQVVSTSSAPALASASQASPSSPSSMGIPKPESSSLSADIAMRFPALSYRGQGLRDGNVAASLADGQLSISDFSVTLPGTTRFTGAGLVALNQPAPSIDGIVSLQTFDARGLFGWLGMEVAGVPPGRLGSASLQGAVQGTFDFLELNDIEGAIDTARIGGRLSYALRARPFVGVDLRIENVNLDGYRAAASLPQYARPAAAPSQPPAKPEVYGVTPTGAPYASLGGFDAEVHVQVDGITAGGLPGGRVGLDLGLRDGTLEIRAASFEKIAGATAWFSGSIGGFGTALRFDNLQFDFAGEDFERFASLFDEDANAPFMSLGAASLIGTLNGGALQADVAATFKAAGLTARAAGQILELEKAPRFVGDVEAMHPRFSELMRAASYAWPSTTRDPGALSVLAHIEQQPGKLVISGGQATVGKDRFSASGEITRSEGKTSVTATLTDVSLDLNRILPEEDESAVRPTAAPGAARGAAAPVSPWSREEFTWSFLNDWSGELSVAGSAFAAQGVALQDFSGRIIVADGAAELADWQGKIFGAPGELSFRFAAVPEPAMSWQVVLKQADFRALVAGLNGGRTGLKSSGTVDLTLGFSTHGRSAADFASALAGGGSLKVTASESGGGVTAGLFGPLNAAAQLDGAGGKPTPITFQTRLIAADGIVKLEGAEVASGSHTGIFSGSIDLPRRQVDISGALTPRKSGAARLPISIRGAMDRANIRLLPPPKS